MTPRYWLHTTPTAPSRSIERDRVIDIAAVLGVPPCAWQTLRESVMSRTDRSVIMHASGGWGGGASFEPRMLMSFYDGASDHAVPVVSAMAAKGELHLAQCDGRTVWIAYWPNCGNLAALTLADSIGEPWPVDTPADPVAVPEPATAALLVLGLALIRLFSSGGR